MIEQQELPRASTSLVQRLAWFGMACAVASLALSITARLSGGAVRWTAWTLPLLIIANVWVLLRGGLKGWPRLVRIFVVLSLALAGALLISEIIVLAHR